ncbi:MAG: hypothetical protein R8G66_01370 [Cytophagales bacterium]|nr:hypothetical protein [Cytophagales bacterium]
MNELRLKELKQIELERGSKVMVLAASMLDAEILPNLYEILLDVGKTERLDVVLYGRGGEINATRRIALLLHQFAEKLCFIVPYHCQSSFTVLSLSGHELIAGDLAGFSPIDPRMNAVGEGVGVDVLDSENIRLFNEMGREWFQLDIEQEETRMQLLASVASSIFPTTLTSLYRSGLELQQIASELLSFQLPEATPDQKSDIINQLLYEYHSHSYAITREELHQLGLKIKREVSIENLAWKIAKELNRVMGGGVRKTPDDPRIDVLLATSKVAYLRQRHVDRIAPVWEEIKL